MSTDEQAAEAVPASPPGGEADPAREPSWWHRDHPTFAALAGFFTGLSSVCLVPALFAGFVGAIAGSERVGDLFPFVLVTLAVPLALVVFERTRRFGAYMWIGILSTAVVVLGVGGMVLWLMVSHQS